MAPALLQDRLQQLAHLGRVAGHLTLRGANTAAFEEADAALLKESAAAPWSGGAPGLLFATTAESWNTCASSDTIRAVAGDGDLAGPGAPVTTPGPGVTATPGMAWSCPPRAARGGLLPAPGAPQG